MRKLLGFITVLLLAVALVACDGGTQGGEGDEEVDKLTIWADSTYWGGENGKLVNEMVKLYQEETGIEVIYEPQPNLKDKMKGAKLGGETADVVIWDRWETVAFVDDDSLVDLKRYIEEDDINLEEYQQEALSEMIDGDGIYGLPLDIDAWGYWVNKTLVREANARLKAEGKPEVQELPKPWDELRETAIATTKRDANGKMTVAGMNLDTAGSFYSYIQTAGGQMLKEEGGQTKAAFNTPQGRMVVQFWYDLIHEHKVFSQELLGTGGGTDDPFVTQLVAIQSNSLLNGSRFYEQYVGDKFEYEFIPFPKGPSSDLALTPEDAGKYAGGLMGGFGLTVPSTSRKQRAAWNLIKWWITDTDKVIQWANISQLIPAKISVIEELKAENIPNVRNVLDVLPYLKVRPKAKGYPSVETAVVMGLIPTVLFGDGYLRGNDTPAKRINALLNDMEKQANETFIFANM